MSDLKDSGNAEIKPKKTINKAFLITSILNWLLGTEIMMLIYMGFPYVKSLTQSEGWALWYRVVPLGFFIGFIGFVMTINALASRKVETPELISARKTSRIFLFLLTGGIAIIALIQTLQVSGVMK
jgi:hypothetical protein